MKTLILQFLIFGLATAAFADDLQSSSITTNQAADLKQKSADNEVKAQLDLFENGKISLDEITTGRDEEWGRELITYYLTHTDTVTTKMKLPVSRCLAGFGKYPEALQLAEDYVKVYSNDWRGWRVLGGSKLAMKSYDGAINALTNAARLGDEKIILVLVLPPLP